MRRLTLALVLAFVSTACAGAPRNGPGARDASGAAATSSDRPITTHPLSFHAGAKRYVVLGRRSHLNIQGHDSVLGDHSLTFRRWWARIETNPAKIVVDIDLRSLESEESLVVSIVRDHMLEVDRYPHATLVGSLEAADRMGNIVIDGVADIHGKQVPLRFTGAIREEGTGYRIQAAFNMSRRAFDVAYAPAEPFLDDAFRVSVDAIATEEHVDVQEGG